MTYTYRLLTEEEMAAIRAERDHQAETEHYTRTLSLAANQELVKTAPAAEKAQIERWIAEDTARIAEIEKLLAQSPDAVEEREEPQ